MNVKCHLSTIKVGARVLKAAVRVYTVIIRFGLVVVYSTPAHLSVLELSYQLNDSESL